MVSREDVHAIISQLGVGYNYKGARMIESAVLLALEEI